MSAHHIALGIVRYLRSEHETLNVYVGPDGAIGFQRNPKNAQEMLPMKLAGTYTENVTLEDVRADLIAMGITR